MSVTGNSKRINIYLKDKVHTDAKIASVLKKTTLASFLEKSISDSVNNDQKLIRALMK
jgi:hypothetical protein